MEGKAKGRGIDPDKYGMVFCPYCKGSGKSLSDTKEICVCKACGGFGLVIKKKEERAGVGDRKGTILLLR